MRHEPHLIGIAIQLPRALSLSLITYKIVLFVYIFYNDVVTLLLNAENTRNGVVVKVKLLLEH